VSEAASPLDRLCWLDPDPLAGSTEHAQALMVLRDRVIHPSLNALEASIDELQSSEDDLDAFVLLDVEPLHQATMEGYLLTVQAMFERAVRRTLSSCVRAYLPKADRDSRITAIQRAHWPAKERNSLQGHFQELLALPFDAFDPAGDLELLYLFGNALRHGDGNAAERIHALCPELWINWLPPGTTIAPQGRVLVRVPADAPAHPSIQDISLPRALLEQLIQAVLWFWEDLDYVRCRSFRRVHPGLAARLEQQQSDRPNRSSQRLWSRRGAALGSP
jgi:hypothetical protein